MYFLQDALDSPLIENDYASVNDALPEGQLQRIKSTQRKAKDKNKLKTGIQCSLGLTPPVLSPTSPIAKILVCPDFPPFKIPRCTAKPSYCHPPQVFRHRNRKTNLNSPVSTAHNYLLTAVDWSVIMECQNWSSDTVIDLIVEGRNRWSVALIRTINLPVFTFLVITFVLF